MRPISGSIVLVIVALGLAAANPVGATLRDLCNGKEVSLKTVEDLVSLDKEANSDGSGGCSAKVLHAIRDMKAITDEQKVCTMQKAMAIIDFVETYLKGSTDKIPKALADFAVAYGMQVSGVCSHEMIDSFSTEADARLYERLGPERYKNFEQFKRFLADESSIGMVLKPMIKTGEVILPADLLQVAPEMSTKIQVYLSRSVLLDNTKMLCKGLLQPLYKSTLLPLAHLIRAGFNNRAASHKSEQLKENSRFWSTAVFMCESLKLIEVKERDTAEQAAIEAKLEEAADNLQDEQEHDIDQTTTDDDDEHNVKPLEATSIAAPRSSGRVGNDIVSPSLGSLIKEFDANKDHVERLRERILDRGMRVIRTMFRRRKFGPMFKELLGLVEISDQSKRAEFEKAKQTMAKYVEVSDHELDSAGANKLLEQSSMNTGVSPHERKGKSSSKFSAKLSKFLQDARKFVGRIVLPVYVCASVMSIVIIHVILSFFDSFKLVKRAQNKAWDYYLSADDAVFKFFGHPDAAWLRL